MWRTKRIEERRIIKMCSEVHTLTEMTWTVYKNIAPLSGRFPNVSHIGDAENIILRVGNLVKRRKYV